MVEFQKQTPIRSESVAKKSNYRDYLPQLAIDFNKRCGYTGSSHLYWGVKFQVDHFAPLKPDVDELKKQAFLDGKLKYENLVYACPQVNRAKWNDWPSDDPGEPISNGKGYYDPGTVNLNDHFYRTDGGVIMPNKDDSIAVYMWHKLKLHLTRYALYWRFDLLKDKLDELHSRSQEIEPGSQHELELLRLINEFYAEIRTYEKYLDLNKNTLS